MGVLFRIAVWWNVFLWNDVVVNLHVKLKLPYVVYRQEFSLAFQRNEKNGRFVCGMIVFDILSIFSLFFHENNRML